LKTCLVLAAMLASCAPAMAQSTRMLMPEGSKDVYLSLATAYIPSAEGSPERRLVIFPLISAQWANGVFIDMNTVGVHLSEQSNMEYGVTLAPSFSRISMVTDNGRQSKKRFTPELGGFFKYHLAHGIGLTSKLTYGGSSDHRGLRLSTGAFLGVQAAPHHSLGISGTFGLANRAALQANYGVTREQASDRLAAYQVKGGLRDTALGAEWNWQVNHKYTFNTVLEYQRLRGSAARSPRIEQPGALSLATVLTYHY
jgi:outer membrane protein